MQPEPVKPDAHPSAVPAAADAPVAPKPLVGTAVSDAIDPNLLTPEEQLARFEQALKETDWGHQPC